jgi:hypothetical protein
MHMQLVHYICLRMQQFQSILENIPLSSSHIDSNEWWKVMIMANQDSINNPNPWLTMAII